MTEDDVRRIAREYYESLFPRECPVCRRQFATLRDYQETTTPIGGFISYDLAAGNQQPQLGTFAYANCRCGNTLALTTDSMPSETRVTLLEWVREESAARGLSVDEMLDYLRMSVRRSVLGTSIEKPE